MSWPDRGFDPTKGLTAITRQRMEASGHAEEAVDRWAAEQQRRALHVGTYEAAIESMLRRMRDQADADNQFHLYRVKLKQDGEIAPGVRPEPTDCLGNAYLPAGVDVLRYVNAHEDPSSVSLAITIDAVEAIQRIPIPLAVNADDSWITEATARLVAAAKMPPRRDEAPLRRWTSRNPTTELAQQARALQIEIGARLPLLLRDRLHAGFDEANIRADPGSFPAKLVGLARLITNPQEALRALDTQHWHTTDNP